MAVKGVKYEVKAMEALPKTIKIDLGDGDKLYSVDKFLTQHSRTTKIIKALNKKKISQTKNLDEKSLLKLARYHGIDINLLDTSTVYVIIPKKNKKF